MKDPIVRLLCERSYCEAHIVRQIVFLIFLFFVWFCQIARLVQRVGGGGVILVGILIWFAGPQRGPTRQTLKNH